MFSLVIYSTYHLVYTLSMSKEKALCFISLRSSSLANRFDVDVLSDVKKVYTRELFRRDWFKKTISLTFLEGVDDFLTTSNFKRKNYSLPILSIKRYALSINVSISESSIDIWKIVPDLNFEFSISYEIEKYPLR